MKAGWMAALAAAAACCAGAAAAQTQGFVELGVVEGDSIVFVDTASVSMRGSLGEADYVLSGLPFSTLPPGVGDAIAEATSKVIRPGGAFLVYQFSPKVKDFIEPHFDLIKRGFEWVNVPPVSTPRMCRAPISRSPWGRIANAFPRSLACRHRRAGRCR